MRLDNFTLTPDTPFSRSDEIGLNGKTSVCVHLQTECQSDGFEVDVEIINRESDAFVRVSLDSTIDVRWLPVKTLDIDWSNLFHEMIRMGRYSWRSIGNEVLEQLIGRLGRIYLELEPDDDNKENVCIELRIPGHEPLSGAVPLDQCSGILHKI